jgi:hypothetical protein
MFVKTFSVLLHLGFGDVPGLRNKVRLHVEFFKREILRLLLLGFPGVSPSEVYTRYISVSFPVLLQNS